MVGFGGSVSPHDEKYLAAIVGVGAQRMADSLDASGYPVDCGARRGQSPAFFFNPTLAIADARPKTNAIANRANGGGFEDVSRYCVGLAGVPRGVPVMGDPQSFPGEELEGAGPAAAAARRESLTSLAAAQAGGDNNKKKKRRKNAPTRLRGATISFLGIANIHAVRGAWEAMRKLTTSKSTYYDYIWLRALEDTNWPTMTRCILIGSLKVARAISRRAQTTLVHCSDGWDRTAQVG